MNLLTYSEMNKHVHIQLLTHGGKASWKWVSRCYVVCAFPLSC